MEIFFQTYTMEGKNHMKKTFVALMLVLTLICGCMVVMAPTEEYPDKSMADLTEEEKNAVLENLIADVDAADYGMMTLENGREVMFYVERGESEIGNVIDIYDGYIIQLIYVRGDFDTLLDSDVEAADAFMNTVAYTPVAAK